MIQLQEDLAPGARDRVMKGLRERGIGCPSYFPAIHLQPYLHAKDYHIPFSIRAVESASERGIALPCYADVREEEVSFVCATLKHLLHLEMGSSSPTEGRAAS